MGGAYHRWGVRMEGGEKTNHDLCRGSPCQHRIATAAVGLDVSGGIGGGIEKEGHSFHRGSLLVSSWCSPSQISLPSMENFAHMRLDVTGVNELGWRNVLWLQSSGCGRFRCALSHMGIEFGVGSGAQKGGKGANEPRRCASLVPPSLPPSVGPHPAHIVLTWFFRLALGRYVVSWMKRTKE